MKRYFHWSPGAMEDPLLISMWRIETPLGYFVGSLAILAISICFEWVLSLRQRVRCKDVPTRAAAALVHVLVMTFAYVLMLIVMTYDLGLTLSVLAGLGLGHFLWRTPAN